MLWLFRTFLSSLGNKSCITEKIIPEFGGADEASKHDISMFMKCHMREFLEKYSGLSGDELAEDRYQRFRRF